MNPEHLTNLPESKVVGKPAQRDLTPEEKRKYHKTAAELAATTAPTLANSSEHTERIRRETGVAGYAPVRGMTREEAERRGLCAPAAAFEGVEGLGEALDPEAEEYAKKHGLIIPKDEKPVLPEAPSPEIAAKWKKDAEKLSKVAEVDLPDGFRIEIEPVDPGAVRAVVAGREEEKASSGPQVELEG